MNALEEQIFSIAFLLGALAGFVIGFHAVLEPPKGDREP